MHGCLCVSACLSVPFPVGISGPVSLASVLVSFSFVVHDQNWTYTLVRMESSVTVECDAGVLCGLGHPQYQGDLHQARLAHPGLALDVLRQIELGTSV